MKKKVYIIVTGLFLLAVQVKAQSPESYNYQGVARNSSGTVLQNQLIGLEFTILQGSANGTMVYQETDTATTNQFGLFTTAIGKGIQVGSNTFSSVNWGGNSEYLEVGMDATGGTNYTIMGTQQLLSVPYALYAANSGGGGGGVGGTGTATQVAFWNSTNTLSGSSNLSWDNSNSWLGIGTSTPAQPLDVNLRNNYTTAKFGDFRPVCLVANDPMIGFNAYWGPSNETYFTSDYAGFIEFNQNVTGGFQFLTAPSGTGMAAATMTPAMTIENNGNVGIGTVAPADALQVASSASYTSEFDNTNDGGTSIYANASGADSWGMDASGGYEGILGITTTALGAYGVVGGNNAAAGTSTGTGVWGGTSQTNGYGVQGINLNGTIGSGIGVYGEGSGAAGTIENFGEGVYGEGEYAGVIGYADGTGTDNICGGFFYNGSGGSDAVCENSGGTQYKINGTGTVSTIVKDNNNVKRIMNCPEAPEILFEDYGAATLSGGKVHVDLDPIYAKNVTINEKHPLRVMITLNDQCNGVYVTNRTTTGFDVVELNNGTSNASFTYEVVANRADEYNDNGTLFSKNADNRFEVSTPLNAIKVTSQTKTVSVPPAHQDVKAIVAPRTNVAGTTAENTNTSTVK